eukprot:8073957-Pyramimonas_sp.AAC.1
MPKSSTRYLPSETGNICALLKRFESAAKHASMRACTRAGTRGRAPEALLRLFCIAADPLRPWASCCEEPGPPWRSSWQAPPASGF